MPHPDVSPHVVIVGAGPVGALSAVLLADHGVSVTLIDRGAGLLTASHASTFHPPTLDLLAGIGIDLASDPQAVRVNSIQWRDRRGEVLAEVDYRLLDGATAHPFRIHLDQQALLDRLADRIAGDSSIDFRPGLTAVGMDAGRTDTRPTVTVRDSDGDRHTLAADLVLGCDGAHSAVRELSGIGFAASEYPTGAIRAFVPGSLDGLMPVGVPALSGLCYFRGGGDGVSLLRMSSDTRLVVRTTGQKDDATRLGQALAAATPLNMDDLDIDRIDVYRLRRGVADTYLSQRSTVLVIGDAAHVTSTAGGLNMNSGLHDAFALIPVVADWLAGRTGRQRVAELAAVRRDYLVRQVIPRTERRVRGLQDSESDSDSYTGHLADIEHLAADPVAARQFLAEASLLDTPLLDTPQLDTPQLDTPLTPERAP